MRPRVERYGSLPEQEGDLHLPDRPRPAVVCLLHGGFWRMPYGRDEMDAVARDLAGRGLAVWNLEYRRVGAPGGGWPGTFEDVVAGIGHLGRLAADGADLDLERVVVCGHSAGGHLALWSAGHLSRSERSGTAGRVRIRAAVGLAPVADLVRAHELGLGGSAVRDLLDGTPEERPEVCRAASPRALLPLGVRQLILHGTADEGVPIEIGRDHVRAARAAGDEVEFIELPGAGHMDHLDPASTVHAALVDGLLRILDGHPAR